MEGLLEIGGHGPNSVVWGVDGPRGSGRDEGIGEKNGGCGLVGGGQVEYAGPGQKARMPTLHKDARTQSDDKQYSDNIIRQLNIIIIQKKYTLQISNNIGTFRICLQLISLALEHT